VVNETVALELAEHPTPTTLALLEREVRADRVHLVWSGAAPSLTCEVQRATADAAWSAIGTVTAEPSGRIVFDDAGVQPGTRYGYRLTESGETLSEIWVDTPARPRLAIELAGPHPAAGVPRVALTLPRQGSATLEVFDLSGRRRARRTVTASMPGRQELALDEARGFAPGVYVLRATQGGESAVRKLAVLQ
jgi:hypothetical protein